MSNKIEGCEDLLSNFLRGGYVPFTLAELEVNLNGGDQSSFLYEVSGLRACDKFAVFLEKNKDLNKINGYLMNVNLLLTPKLPKASTFYLRRKGETFEAIDGYREDSDLVKASNSTQKLSS